MTTKQRKDLQMNIPALKKLDAMLIVRTTDAKCSTIILVTLMSNRWLIFENFFSCQDCLDNFKDQNEFYYVKKEENEKGSTDQRKDDKWWLPTVKVPPNGLSEMMKKWLQFQKDSVNQVLKAAMAINAQVLSEMEIPENYIELLPKVIGMSQVSLRRISHGL